MPKKTIGGFEFNIPAMIVGANVTVKVDGKPAAFIENVQRSANYNTRETYALGSYLPVDARSMKYSGRLSGKIWLLGDPEEGGITLPDLTNILTADPNLFEFYRKSDGKRIMRLLCRLDSERSSIDTDNPTSRDVDFVIIREARQEGYN